MFQVGIGLQQAPDNACVTLLAEVEELSRSTRS